MTTTENLIAIIEYLVKVNHLLEMTTTENGVRIRLANGIRYLPAWNDNHRKPPKDQILALPNMVFIKNARKSEQNNIFA